MKLKIKILIIALVGICLGTTISNAAIEIKPGSASSPTAKGTTAYEYCYNMRAFSSSLGANSLDPHMSLCKDFGAVAYLGASGYGNVRNNNGYSIAIDGISYYSTTKNATGVMNLGKNQPSLAAIYTQVANQDGLRNLYNNRNTKYVESIEDITLFYTIEGSLGMNVAETKQWYNSSFSNMSNTNSLYRVSGVFGSNSVGHNSTTTYRPALWN